MKQESNLPLPCVHAAEAAATREAILGGKAAEDATADDIKALTKAEFVELFKTLPAASLDELNGVRVRGLSEWDSGPPWVGETVAAADTAGCVFSVGVPRRDPAYGPHLPDRLLCHALEVWAR